MSSINKMFRDQERIVETFRLTMLLLLYLNNKLITEFEMLKCFMWSETINTCEQPNTRINVMERTRFLFAFSVIF